MKTELLISIIENRIATYERFTKQHEEHGLYNAAATTRALSEELKEILSYIKE